ncbi:Rne/Rng family ribonuclease [Heliorestis acidaminivorans]|uniref:Rne/Rng family ribonuclease n=1 Tax=Heliorestis acidaminivorans TaxID=553427 RepID=UPI001478E56D|nr:ribonuclease E/G [Heliorestis acidaminivorans]
MIAKKIIIQAKGELIIAGVLEEGRLVELYWHDPKRQRLEGNIYKGPVVDLLPGMNAAFVDIGTRKNAYLSLKDWSGPEISEGQEVVVQVVNEGNGQKGPRLTSQITVPGRYLVITPFLEQVGLSKKIDDEAERNRLLAIAQKLSLLAPTIGLIIRTAAEGMDEEALVADFQSLLIQWQRLKEKAENLTAPALLYQECLLTEMILRDLVDDSVTEIDLNQSNLYEEMLCWAKDNHLCLQGRIKLFEGCDFFPLYNLCQQIEKALAPKVWLPNGGYLIIEKTEALTVVDVNTGRYKGAQNLSETVRRTNIEAAEEIAYQLRLRNIGGMVIIDFIDMIDEDHRQEVLTKLKEKLARDKVKTEVFGFTALGLLEMTRKKTRESLASIFVDKDIRKEYHIDL